jgi:hypothetical protein
MLAINLPPALEKYLWTVVQDSYQGDVQAAMTAFLRLHEKYGWKEQLLQDVQSIRNEVRQQGGIKGATIELAVKKYRKQINVSN